MFSSPNESNVSVLPAIGTGKHSHLFGSYGVKCYRCVIAELLSVLTGGTKALVARRWPVKCATAFSSRGPVSYHNGIVNQLKWVRRDPEIAAERAIKRERHKNHQPDEGRQQEHLD